MYFTLVINIENHKKTQIMKTLCQITAQYYENYSDTETPHWKPKGGQVFNLMVDAHVF
jgi:DNA-binding ferritin-like protein